MLLKSEIPSTVLLLPAEWDLMCLISDQKLSHGCPWKRLLHHAWIKFQCWLSGGDVRVALATCSLTESIAIHVHCALCSDIKSFLVCSSFVAMSRNLICEWFCKSETDASKAKCTKCSKQLSLGSELYTWSIRCSFLIFVFGFGRK